MGYSKGERGREGRGGDEGGGGRGGEGRRQLGRGMRKERGRGRGRGIYREVVENAHVLVKAVYLV